MKPIYRDAILKASQIRKQLGLGMFQPINIFDACTKMGIDIRFVDLNMEGFYVIQNNTPSILISTKRPLPRRTFTCGHELGHHVFGHGSKLDILSDEKEHTTIKDDDEILVDAFAAALLMPVGAIQAEFVKRSWNIQNASPVNFYTICSVFGVGYQTLVVHCKVSGLITESKAVGLLKLTPAKIFKTHFGAVEEKSYFRIMDEYAELSVVDLEVSNYIILPFSTLIEGQSLEKIGTSELGCVYIAKKPGIFTANNSGKSYFIRIQRENYIGFAEYRHLEN